MPPAASDAKLPPPVAVNEHVFTFMADAAAGDGRSANVSVVTGPLGAIVWNTGVSYRHGRALLQAMLGRLETPIRLALISHAFQDVLFGWQAFSESGIPVWMHRGAYELMQRRCHECLRRLEASLGAGAMAGTRLVEPTRLLEGTTELVETGAVLTLLDLGHTSGPNDLALFDPRSGTLLAGATVMTDELLELRDARVSDWLDGLHTLRALPVTTVVPDYGSIGDARAIDRTMAYLTALDQRVDELLQAGVSLANAAGRADLPAFAHWRYYDERHPRNVHRRYLALELRYFQ
jgi:glyoxylase-like metal-dependent hydrolase (beta-lactamase superfamily II)